MKVSIVLDRRSFVTGAALAAGVVAVTVRSALPYMDGVGAGEWAVDHIFGAYPPYAHPIPYGRPLAATTPPIHPGPFDPFLMI
jgi:hypothetical protein